MPDLTTLALLASLFLGAVVGQAALFGDTLRVRITVPPGVQETGFTETVAEALFSTEAARIIRGESIVPAPAVRIHSQPTVLSALVQPLRLQEVVPALQDQLGIDVLSVDAALLRGGDPAKTPLEMVVMITRPNGDPEQTRIPSKDNDPVHLVRDAAQWTMERISPYRVALANFLSGTEGDPDGFTRARQTATRALSEPWTLAHASERAMHYNILALVAAANNDLPSALAAYRSLAQIPQVMPAVRAEASLNEAIIALAMKDPDRAAALTAQARAGAASVDLVAFPADLELVEALVAWGQGDLAKAERGFRRVADEAPSNEAGHRYLGKLLAARGDAEGSAKALNQALAVHRSQPLQQEVAVQLFWVDPVAGGLTRRF